MKSEEKKEKKKKEKEPFHALAYRVLGEKIEALIPHVEDLRSALRKAGISVSLRAYASMMVFTSLIVFISVSASISTMLYAAIRNLYAIMAGIGIGLLAGAGTFWGLYLYPSIKASSRGRKLDSSLPYVASLMAILASTGIPPERLFRSLIYVDAKLHIQDEAKEVVRDIEIFGKDVITVLSERAMYSPSKLLRDLYEGLVSTAKSGGDLRRYLYSQARMLMRMKRIMMRKSLENLAMLAEIYVALLIAMPLVFSIMLAVMSTLGGGPIDPVMALQVLTYFVIPVLSIVFVILLDSTIPREG